MVSVITDKIDAISRACEQFRFERLGVFGSALREDFDSKRSGIAFLVKFGSMSPSDKPMQPGVNW
jgi:predicted nucleotidyltransferase